MDPVTFLSMWTTGNGNNNTNWGSPKFDALIEEAARTGDPERRFAILHDAEDKRGSLVALLKPIDAMDDLL